MNKFETTKLFWDEYLYKLTITNKLSHIFREKKFSHARQVLDELQLLYDLKEPLILVRGLRRTDYIQEDSFHEAKMIYKLLTKFDDYKLRVEQSSLCVYTNNYNWLNELMQKLPRSIRELYQPDPKFVSSLEKGIIFTETPTNYEYKVTFGTKKFDHFGLSKWIKANPDKAKAGAILLDELENGHGYVNNMYLYIRDEKILQLLSLMCSNIRRVDKIVCKTDLDK